MASRAHVIHDYDYDYDYVPRREVERARRQVLYRSSDDPIEIPRGSSSSFGGMLAISAVVASSVILGGAYALYAGPPPVMAGTPTLALTPTWQLDDQPLKSATEKA